MRLVQIDESSQTETGERILEAATQVFLEFGYKRTTIDTVAKRLGISRVTVYRHFKDKESLFQAILLRDLAKASVQIENKLGKLSENTNPIVEGFVVTAIEVRKHPLIQRFLETEPEWLVLHMTVEGSKLFQFACTTATIFLKQEKFKGWLDENNTDLLAEILIRLLFSAVLTSGGFFGASNSVLRESVSKVIESFVVKK